MHTCWYDTEKISLLKKKSHTKQLFQLHVMIFFLCKTGFFKNNFENQKHSLKTILAIKGNHSLNCISFEVI